MNFHVGINRRIFTDRTLFGVKFWRFVKNAVTLILATVVLSLGANKMLTHALNGDGKPIVKYDKKGWCEKVLIPGGERPCPPQKRPWEIKL